MGSGVRRNAAGRNAPTPTASGILFDSLPGAGQRLGV